MPGLVFYLCVFLAIGVVFLFFHLLLGHFIRPNRPDAEKLTIYECGEPTVGSAWVQFDLRYYVVALLFVVFDVEVAFFFPWAVVFGKANDLAKDLPPERRAAITRELTPAELNLAGYLSPTKKTTTAPEKKTSKGPPLGKGGPGPGKGKDGVAAGPKKGPPPTAPAAPPEGVSDAAMAAMAKAGPLGMMKPAPPQAKARDIDPIDPDTAKGWAWVAFADILIFFGVLMVGFAYVWRRGDINWVRTVSAET